MCDCTDDDRNTRIESYKEPAKRFADQIAEKAKQTVVDLGKVMKSQESTLHCEDNRLLLIHLLFLFFFHFKILLQFLYNIVSVF